MALQFPINQVRQVDVPPPLSGMARATSMLQQQGLIQQNAQQAMAGQNMAIGQATKQQIHDVLAQAQAQGKIGADGILDDDTVAKLSSINDPDARAIIQMSSQKKQVARQNSIENAQILQGSVAPQVTSPGPTVTGAAIPDSLPDDSGLPQSMAPAPTQQIPGQTTAMPLPKVQIAGGGPTIYPQSQQQQDARNSVIALKKSQMEAAARVQEIEATGEQNRQTQGVKNQGIYNRVGLEIDPATGQPTGNLNPIGQIRQDIADSQIALAQAKASGIPEQISRAQQIADAATSRALTAQKALGIQQQNADSNTTRAANAPTIAVKTVDDQGSPITKIISKVAGTEIAAPPPTSVTAAMLKANADYEQAQKSFTAIQNLAKQNTYIADQAMADQFFNIIKPGSGARMNQQNINRLVTPGPLKDRLIAWAQILDQGQPLTPAARQAMIEAARAVMESKAPAPGAAPINRQPLTPTAPVVPRPTATGSDPADIYLKNIGVK